MLATIDSAPSGRAGLTDEHEPLPHVGAEDVELLVAVEVHQVDVRHGRRVGHVRHRQRMPRESNRATRRDRARPPARADARAHGW